MAISSTSGSFTVICHGADGHVAMEPLMHNRCKCPETDTQANPVSFSRDCLDGHGHCRDYIPASHLMAPSSKTHKQSIDQTLTSGLIQYVDSLIHTSLYGNFPSHDNYLPAFHMPLRTVVLLA